MVRSFELSSATCISVCLLAVFTTNCAAEVVMSLRDAGRMVVSHEEEFAMWDDWKDEIAVGVISPSFVSPPTVRSLEIDLNGDGVTELFVTGTLFSTFVSTRGSTEIGGLEKPENAGSSGSYAWAFQRGQLIGPEDVIHPLDPEGVKWLSDESTGGPSGMASGAHFSSGPGLLFHTTPGLELYLGVRLQIDGRWHYGWIMVLRARWGGDSLPIAGWAFETTAETPVSAGPPHVARPNGSWLLPGKGREAFEPMDRNGDSKLSITEYSASMPTGSRRTSAMHRFRFLDFDRDQVISWGEFLDGGGGDLAGAPSKLRSFLFADLDHDGLIQAGEWPLWYASHDRSIRVMKAFDRIDVVGEPRTSLLHGSLTPLEFGISENFLAREAARFEEYDVDGSGGISKSEFIAGAHPALSVSGLKNCFSLSDINHNGELSPLEFAGSDSACSPIPTRDRLFALADVDKSGFLDPPEFSDTRPRSLEWRKVMKEFRRKDFDQDGRLSIEEF